MFKRLIKKLVKVCKEHRLAHQKILRQQYNDNVIHSILKDLDERN